MCKLPEGFTGVRILNRRVIVSCTTTNVAAEASVTQAAQRTLETVRECDFGSDSGHVSLIIDSVESECIKHALSYAEIVRRTASNAFGHKCDKSRFSTREYPVTSRKATSSTTAKVSVSTATPPISKTIYRCDFCNFVSDNATLMKMHKLKKTHREKPSRNKTI